MAVFARRRHRGSDRVRDGNPVVHLVHEHYDDVAEEASDRRRRRDIGVSLLRGKLPLKDRHAQAGDEHVVQAGEREKVDVVDAAAAGGPRPTALHVFVVVHDGVDDGLDGLLRHVDATRCLGRVGGEVVDLREVRDDVRDSLGRDAIAIGGVRADVRMERRTNVVEVGDDFEDLGGGVVLAPPDLRESVAEPHEDTPIVLGSASLLRGVLRGVASSPLVLRLRVGNTGERFGLCSLGGSLRRSFSGDLSFRRLILLLIGGVGLGLLGGVDLDREIVAVGVVVALDVVAPVEVQPGGLDDGRRLDLASFGGGDGSDGAVGGLRRADGGGGGGGGRDGRDGRLLAFWRLDALSRSRSVAFVGGRSSGGTPRAARLPGIHVALRR